MQFGIAIFPSKEVQDYANSLRKRFDPHYTLLQPHLTLREPEEWNEQQLTQAVEHLERTTSILSPFELVFNRFSTFYPVSHVIYMALQDAEPMLRCYRSICSLLLTESEAKPRYTPHLTIGQQLGSDELHDVYASLRNKMIRFQCRADRLHLLYKTDNGAWTVHQTFLFRGTSG